MVSRKSPVPSTDARASLLGGKQPQNKKKTDRDEGFQTGFRKY